MILFFTKIALFIPAFFAAVASFILIPYIVRMARVKSLYDRPNARKVHSKKIPRLGGLSLYTIFIVMISFIYTFPYIYRGITPLVDVNMDVEFFALIMGLTFLFLTGILDDLDNVKALHKLFIQIVASTALIIFARFQLNSLSGILGFNEINPIIGFAITLFVILLTINAFNLIDGIDGLASSIGIIASLIFGLWFYFINLFAYASLAFGVTTSLMAFFYFNVFSKKNKLFMGDTGSQIIGFILVFFALKFCSINIVYPASLGYFKIDSVIALSFSIFILPLLDVIWVFSKRVFRKRSPFAADKTHIHHRILLFGFSHLTSTLIIISINLIFIAMNFMLREMGNTKLILLDLVLVVLVYIVIELLLRHKMIMKMRLTEGVEIKNKI